MPWNNLQSSCSSSVDGDFSLLFGAPSCSRMIRKVIHQAKGEHRLGASGSQGTVRPYEPVISHHCHKCLSRAWDTHGHLGLPFSPCWINLNKRLPLGLLPPTDLALRLCFREPQPSPPPMCDFKKQNMYTHG